MTQPKVVIEGGVAWAPFSVNFTTQEGVFGFTLYAINTAHAIERLEELKATATLVGPIVHVITNGKPPP